jgi:hypothetical protein
MNTLPTAAEILGAMITPAVLISASGMLVLSTSNRLSRVVDRVRVLAAEVEKLGKAVEPDSSALARAKRELILEQLSRLSDRAILLRSALTSLYIAIGLLVATSIVIGVVDLLPWRFGWIPVVGGLIGACALLYGSILLIREAKLAIASTLHEMRFVRDAVTRQREGDN